MCSLDHGRVAVPDCKRGITIMWPTSLSRTHQIPLTPSANPPGELERWELMVGWGRTEMMILEWKVLRSESSRRKRGSHRNAI